MTDQPLDLDAILARAAAATPGPWAVSEDYDDILDTEGGQLASYWMEADGQFIAHAREDVEAMAAEIRRLRADLADFSGRVNELESKLCDCEPVREHGDWKRPAFYQHEAQCPVTQLTQPDAVETHVVADDSDDPEHIDDCPGCQPARP
jgi:hypothetical protein